ncbi:hypothetical protein NL108_002915 [Boleophthalmus pectinirostris]|uniref:KH domain-containing, RNA-binding, signal transduction-associated protein 1b n=1 Tax=Boleophthalmus pectinirostris TaxID=150288 RepID=UPI000A1C6EC2|nr:KH domain-containing, RNA-binding, signal transduction-associated protein 1b [Boleophthalmus pectinirostris]XP_055013324.1 KH domain-containing, RNA-binding, signal transduction-associated protein 1b [Boleophthalmus pectinirostris]KAJ0054778.1 hypothetical protein NL108_002915 [Boleophthalmus pectinirostris]
MENGDKYLPELLAEKDTLDMSFTHSMKLLNAEIDRIQKGETKKDTETYLDLFTTKNIKLKERVLIPVKQYPKFNFVGKILGPQGNTIKRLQEETGAKISVLGKGSMRDKAKEEDLRNGGEPKYAHLSMELHVFIEVFAPVPDAYLRMAHAMEEVKKFLFPDMMDEICQEQFMEMSYLNGGQEHGARGRGGMPVRGRGVPPGAAHRGRGMPPRGAARGGVSRGGPTRGGAGRGAPAGRGGPTAAPARGAAAPRARPPTAGPPQRMAPPPHQHTTAAATDSYEDYGYDESYTETGYESYDSYYSQPQADPEYYDYSHGETTESYDSYGQDGWNGTQRTTPGKAPPPSRGAKAPYREHPYRQY